MKNNAIMIKQAIKILYPYGFSKDVFTLKELEEICRLSKCSMLDVMRYIRYGR